MKLLSYIPVLAREYSHILAFIALFSLVFFFLTLLILPAYLVLMPHDILAREPQGIRTLKPLRAVFQVILLLLKNVLGLFLVLLGIALLFLPGQGLLTIFAGLLLVNIPGKRRILTELLGRPGVKTPLNKLRHRFGRPPLLSPGE